MSFKRQGLYAENSEYMKIKSLYFAKAEYQEDLLE